MHAPSPRLILLWGHYRKRVTWTEVYLLSKEGKGAGYSSEREQYRQIELLH